MAKATKATKKFNRKHLKGELERRQKHKKAQQLYKKRELRKSRRSGGGGAEDGEAAFTGIEEVDDLAEFASSSIKGVGEDLGKFMQADPENDSDGEASMDSDDVAALLEAGDSSDASVLEESDGGDLDDGDSDDGDSLDGDSGDEEEAFKRDLEAMKEKDPAFFQFMEKNDPAALAILEQGGSDEDEGSGEGSDDSDDAAEKDSKRGGASAEDVTVNMLKAWEAAVTKSHSTRALKKLLLAFYSASHMDTESGRGSDVPYRIRGVDVFNKTISTTIRVTPGELGHYAPIVDGKIKKTGQWGMAQALAKSYLAGLLELLRQMSDPAMIQYLIKECGRVLPYFSCFIRYTRDLVKELLRQFGSAASDDGVRILALLTLRQLVAGSPTAVVDVALKGLYLTYVRHSNVKTMESLTTIQLMRNCGVELYGIDGKASYQHAFVYIRQLAIHLRNSMQLRSKESFRAIYNWQFINSLWFWTEVLATYCGDRAEAQPDLCATLESLVYPLTQIILGVARLVPTARYFPLRIQCISQLLRLSAATGVYIPVLPMIIEVLESPEFINRRPVRSTLKPLALDAHLKAPREYEHTHVYLESILESVFGLLADAVAAHSVRIAFPEWVVPATLQLRRWRKRVGKSWSRFSKQLQGLLEKTDQTARMVQQRRAKVDFSPANLAAVNQFMNDVQPDTTPIGAYAASLRKVRAQQRATLAEAARAE
ncbi:Nucleolar Complex 2 protein [Coemansia sp. RSA 552]|nr:Nucleolar Complex 2 protein [Coemansia sp. RSA 552]